jgi:murein DD-endopeptidase MepM/ murein hydrolase activator NlpD
MSLHLFTRSEAKRTGYHFCQKTADGLIHSGIDYNYGIGDQDKYQPVMSPTWGVVEYVSPSGTNGGLGNYLVIHHPHNDAWTRYMHLDSITVKEGETVYPNQTVGYLGDTGTTSSHLHAEVLNHKGIEFIRHYIRPYGRYTKGLTRDQVQDMWTDPEKWLAVENHYVGPNVQQRLNQAQNALRWATGLRRNMLLRLIERLVAMI